MSPTYQLQVILINSIKGVRLLAKLLKVAERCCFNFYITFTTPSQFLIRSEFSQSKIHIIYAS